MTTNVVWPISVDNVEDLLRVKFKLEFPASIWACGMSEDGGFLLIAAEVDDSDLAKLGVDEFDIYDEEVEHLFN